MLDTSRDHKKVVASARKCLAELAGLGDLITTQQVAMAIGFCEGLLDELIETAEAGPSAPMVGVKAASLLGATL